MRLEKTTSRACAAFALAATIVVVAACGSPGPTSPTSPPTTTGSQASTTSPDTPTPETPPASETSETTTPDPPPPYIDHVQWAQTDVGASLQVYPTPAGRQASAETAMAQAWHEVLVLAPTANTPTMKAQFDCHWTFARLVDPMKASWNLEPSRPVVTSDQMIAARCNPGGAEEGPAH